MGRIWRGVRGLVGACTVMVLASLAFAGQAGAVTGLWNIRSVFAPAQIAPGASGELIVTATNIGDAPISVSAGDPLTVLAQLPAGVSATSISNDELFPNLITHYELPELSCEQTTLTCQAAKGIVYPAETLQVVIDITVAREPQPGSKAKLSISGGGVSPASSEDAVPVSSTSVKFGVERFESVPLNEDGSIDVQAGSHPFQFTTTLTFNQGYESQGKRVAPLAMPRSTAIDLPPGLVGNPTAIPLCPGEKFNPGDGAFSACPPDTAVGVAQVTVSFFKTAFEVLQPVNIEEPIYNLVPPPGEPVRLGFLVPSLGPDVPVYLDTSVQTGGNYSAVVTVHNIAQELWFTGAQVSLWGTPSDPRHNGVRGQCLYEYVGTECLPEERAPKGEPFLTLPGSCTGLSNPFTTSVEATSWEDPSEESPAQYVLHEGSGSAVGMDGCNRLGFDPEIAVAPDGEAASSPSGLTVDVHVPQQESSVATGLSEATVKDTTVALPAGVALNPAAADGLQACSEGLAGFTGFAEYEPGAQTATFTPQLPEPLQPGVDFCPDASKIGTVNIKTPLLANELTGSVYLAAQNENPFGSLVAMYIVARDPVSGVLIKVPGEVSLDEHSGQIVATFKNTPQLPFEDFTLHFFGGNRAPLATPAYCGSYTTSSSFTPWTGNPSVTPSSTFDIASGPNGSPCPGASLPFSPELTAGSTSIQAGGFSPFTMTVSRNDGQQNIQQFQLHMPEGLSGLLPGVELCGEAQANAGTCGSNSQIGETTVGVGLGGDPYSVTGGKVYITGPYEGAPFGVSVVVPAKAGPYNLGQVIVRGKIEVNPTTAALTVTTNSPSQGHAIPHILDGIPLEIKHVNFVTTRPGFTFNPTSCDPLSVTGSFSSVEGASSPLSVPFQVTNCAVLGFEPAFKVSTSAKTSRADGASLSVKLSYPSGSLGKDANIAKVKVDLPERLPSRLSTLQKACTAQAFAANPASCPPTSVVGHAVVHTQLLPVPLEGPAYFVSNGGEAFPNLIVVLQGYGVTFHLVGDTFIKNGVTSSTFAATPDVPFESFELTLPEGPYSALAANGDLCRQKLVMPTAFTAQNGAALERDTRIEVTGCPHALSVLSRRVTKRSVKIGVYVPAAGKLEISGRGVAAAGKSATGPEALSLALRREGRGKLTSRLKVAFTPANGPRQTRTVTVAFSG
jgi:hypothetical protein